MAAGRLRAGEEPAVARARRRPIALTLGRTTTAPPVGSPRCPMGAAGPGRRETRPDAGLPPGGRTARIADGPPSVRAAATHASWREATAMTAPLRWRAWGSLPPQRTAAGRTWPAASSTRPSRRPGPRAAPRWTSGSPRPGRPTSTRTARPRTRSAPIMGAPQNMTGCPRRSRRWNSGRPSGGVFWHGRPAVALAGGRRAPAPSAARATNPTCPPRHDGPPGGRWTMSPSCPPSQRGFRRPRVAGCRPHGPFNPFEGGRRAGARGSLRVPRRRGGHLWRQGLSAEPRHPPRLLGRPALVSPPTRDKVPSPS
jgi:hypothetical protein